MSKRSNACAIPMRVKRVVYERDQGRCILCGAMGDPWCHYIARSHGGLGIEENIVTLCPRCHYEYDNGRHHWEIKGQIRKYLQWKYPDWDEKKLTYTKGDL